MIDLQLNTHNTEITINNLAEKVQDLSPAFKNVHAYMVSNLQRQFDTMSGFIKEGGREARGVRWKYFAPQYVRKDGTVVPAWGIPGEVKGRLRHSGRRVKKGDSIVQDDRTLRNNLLMDYRIGKQRMDMDTNDDPTKVFVQNKMRPFQFFESPKDVNRIKRILERFITSES